MGKVKEEYKMLMASYAQRFVEHKLTPGNDSGDWSMKDPDTSCIYVCPRPSKQVDIVPNWTCLKPENICVVNGDGVLVEDNGMLPTVELPMHLAIYRARPDAMAIVHSHPLYSSAFAITGKDIPLVLAEQAIFLGGETRCADYSPAGSDALGVKIVEALGDTRKSALMCNHGAVVLGKDLREAFILADYVEHSALVSIMGYTIGKPLALDPDNVLDPSICE